MPTKQEILNQINAVNTSLSAIGKGVDVLITLAAGAGTVDPSIATALTSLSDETSAIAGKIAAVTTTVDLPPAPPSGPPA